MSAHASDDPERQNLDADIGRRIFHRMWDRKITQTEMGKKIGVGQSTLSKKLRGERPWYSTEIRIAAETLGVSVGSLFGENDEGPGGGAPRPSLPRLDSNQQPIGLQPRGELIYVDFAASTTRDVRANERVRQDVVLWRTGNF